VHRNTGAILLDILDPPSLPTLVLTLYNLTQRRLGDLSKPRPADLSSQCSFLGLVIHLYASVQKRFDYFHCL